MQGLQNEIQSTTTLISLGEPFLSSVCVGKAVVLGRFSERSVAVAGGMELAQAQLAQKDRQIEDLHGIIEKILSGGAQHKVGELSLSIQADAGSMELQAQYLPSPTDMEEARHRKKDLERMIEFDFPQACVVALEFESWLRLKQDRLLRPLIAGSYRLLARVEIAKIERCPAEADMAKERARSFLELAKKYDS